SRRRPVPQVEAGPDELLSGRRAEAARRVQVAWEEEGRHQLRSLLALAVPGGVGVLPDFLGHVGRPRHAQRGQDEIAHGGAERLAGDHLDEATEHDEPDVVVAEERPQREELRESRQLLGYEASDRVVAAAAGALWAV